MSREQVTGKKGKYYFVYDGAFRTSVSPDHPDAITRINKKGVTVHEKEVRALFGKIEDISFFDGDFGRNLLITLDPNEDNETPILSFGAESMDGEQVMKKLPNVDLTKEVRISPYKFIPDDSEKERRGISIFQQDEAGNFTVKITDFFWDGKNNLNGMPEINWEESSLADRKIHFIKVNEFLVKYTTENIIPKLAERTTSVSPIPHSYEEQELSREFKKTSTDAAGLINEDVEGIPF